MAIIIKNILEKLPKETHNTLYSSKIQKLLRHKMCLKGMDGAKTAPPYKKIP